MQQWNTARQPPELMHYGIKGQKWGVRNYQNDDGSLTPAGKERYGSQNGGQKRGLFGIRKKSKTSDRDWNAKDAKKLSDEELRNRNNRLQAEQNYKNNTTPQWKKDVKQNSKTWRSEVLKTILITAAAGALSEALRSKVYKPNAEKIVDLTKQYANRKIATIKATNMLKKAIDSKIVFDNRGPEIIGKHAGRR